MASEQTGLSSPEVRALTRELTALRQELDAVKAGLRSSQLGRSTVDDGALWFTDAAGLRRVSIGKQVDGKFGFGAVNGDPPPRPTPPSLEAGTTGITIGWDGQFVGVAPSDFVHVKAFLSPVGAGFIPGDSNCVGHLLGNAKLPVSPLDPDTNYWCVLIAYNTSGVASDPSIVVGPVSPKPVIADEVRDGIVTELALAADAVTSAKIAAGAVGTTQLAGGSVSLAKLADGSVSAAKLIDGSVTGPKIVTGAVGADQIAANAIVAGKLAADAVQAGNIVAGAVQTNHIAADAVAAGKVAADAITGREIRALSILADHIAANAIKAGHLDAGSVTADKLAALLVLANTIVAGDPDSWHLELGDSTTPILYWDNANTGFAVSRDQVTGQSNVYMSGRVEFGNGSSIEQDYLDLCEQPATGMLDPKIRQQRVWLNSGRPSATARWESATKPGSLVLLGVFQTAVAGSTPPNCSTPAGATIIESRTSGPHRLTLFAVYPHTSASRSVETFGSSAGDATWSIAMLEYTGVAADGVALDVQSWASGLSATAQAGTTATTATAKQLQVGVFGAAGLGSWTTPSAGFSRVIDGRLDTEQGIAVTARTASATGAVSPSLGVSKTVPWIGIAATFRTAPASPTPRTPPERVVRLFTRSRGGVSTPYMLDATGAAYPIGRLPYCRARLNVTTTPPGADAPGFYSNATDVYAQGDWVASSDPYQMVSISTSTSTYSNITIPITGMWRVAYKSIFQASSVTDNVAAAFVTCNARDANASIARDSQPFRRYGVGDWTPVHALRDVPLTAGDVLYWGNWSNVNALVATSRSNIPTEITVTFLGPTV